jgi:lantibiotic modifying enzyme
MSALGADGTQDPDIRRLAWQSINTDQMMLSGEMKFEAPMTHRVRLADRLPSVADHLSTFLEGFKAVYFYLLENKQRLLSDDRLLTSFEGLDLRILVRNTATYTRLHLYLMHPEFLKDGIDRSIELEWLARPLSGTVTPSKGRKLLYEHERAAMENLDIPHFNISIWRNMEHEPEDEDLFLLCGERDSRVIRRRLSDLSMPDCSKQLEIIEEAVRSRFALK